MLRVLDPRSVAAALCLAIACAPQLGLAGPIVAATFYEFGSTDVGVAATGCQPDDPGGNFCISSSGTPTLFADAPPWTFLAGAGGSTLDGDRCLPFRRPVRDLRLRREPRADLGARCVGLRRRPVPCLADPGMSHGLFALAAGAHSLTIVLAAGGSAARATSRSMPSGRFPSRDRLPSQRRPSLSFGCSVGGRPAEAAADRRCPADLPAVGKPHSRTEAPMTTTPTRARLPRGQTGSAARATLLAALAAAGLVYFQGVPDAATPGVDQFVGPTSSQPLALSANGAFLVAANPDNNSVTFFDLRNDRNRRLAEIPVAESSRTASRSCPTGARAYVANTVSGTVSVIPREHPQRFHRPADASTSSVGTEPYGARAHAQRHEALRRQRPLQLACR